MATSILQLGAVGFLLALVYQYIIVPVFLSQLAKVPNAHFSSPVLPLWMWWKRRGGTATQIIYALHQKHGPVVRLGPNELSVNSAGGLKTIYVGGFEKDKWYRDEFINFETPNLVSMLEHRPHSLQKRMISNVYSKSYLQNSSDLRQIAKTLLFERFFPALDSAVQNNAPFNVYPFFEALGTDFTSAYLFGSVNGSDFLRDNEGRNRWLGLHSKYKERSQTERGFEKWCLDMCEGAEKLISNPEDKELAGSTQPVVYGQLSKCLREELPDPGQRKLRVASEMLDHLVAGFETSAITLTYLMYEVSQRPSVQSRLREELLTLSPPIKYSPADLDHHLVSAKLIDGLPLLDAVLRETLRRYAAAPGPQPRLTPFTPGGTTIEGYTNIPGGVKVSSSAYTLHRNAEVYPEPEAWRPERWLNCDTLQLEQMRRWFWAFGSGGRMCLGSNFAIQELKLVTAAIYTNYTTEVVDDDGIEQSDEYIAVPISKKLILRFKHV